MLSWKATWFNAILPTDKGKRGFCTQIGQYFQQISVWLTLVSVIVSENEGEKNHISSDYLTGYSQKYNFISCCDNVTFLLELALSC
jgi:hypothetical protein